MLDILLTRPSFLSQISHAVMHVLEVDAIDSYYLYFAIKHVIRDIEILAS